MVSFPLSSPTSGHLVDAITRGFSGTDMGTLFMKAGVDDWAEPANNKASRVQVLLANLRQDGTNEAVVGALELARLVLAHGKADGWSEAAPWWEPLKDAIAADGWEFDDERDVLVPMVPAVQVADETGWVEAELRRRGWTTPAGHYRQAIDSFSAGNWAAANGQLRTFFESLIRTAGGANTGSSKAGQVQAAVDALDGLGRLLSNEGAFAKALWRFLHAGGSHPGLSDQHESRFRLLTLTGYARFLLSRLPG
jgi:hypothetical protein